MSACHCDGTPNPTTEQRSVRIPPLHHFQVGEKSPLRRCYLPTPQHQPFLGLSRGGKRVPCCPQTPQLPTPSSPEAVATAAIVASALLATAPGGYSSDCRELGSAQLLRPQVPWIRKLGQAPGIGGENGARANQRPPRVPREPQADARRSRAPGAVRMAAATAPAPAPATHARTLPLAPAPSSQRAGERCVLELLG